LKNRDFRHRLSFALGGLKHAFRNERSFRTHVVFACLALLALIVLRPDFIWWALVGFVAALVLCAELLNSAIEEMIDLLHPDLHDRVKAIKDMAAGAVLVAAFAALWVGAFLLVSVLSKGFPF
jgi:undecaprenol kinase